MKTYVKFLLNIFFNSFLKTFCIFFGIIFIMNMIDQAEFLKKIEVHFAYPLFLSFLNSPSIIFEILPFIFLITTQVFFIKLMNSSELEIFKYVGLTNLRITKIVALFSFLIGIFFVVFFYNFSSILKSNYLKIKNKYSDDNKYLAVITENGLWMKDVFEGKVNIINANKVDNKYLIDVLIVQLDLNYELIKTIKSTKIDISSYEWIIHDAKITENNTSVNSKEMKFFSNFDLKKINSLFSNLSSLNFIDLIKLRKSYKSLNYSLVEIDSHMQRMVAYPFYLTLITILTSIVMFNVGYQKSTLYKIIFGIFLSVIIYYINNFFNILGTSEKIPLIISIWFPLIILSIINLTFIMKINEK